jgi:hypothetical protein
MSFMKTRSIEAWVSMRILPYGYLVRCKRHNNTATKFEAKKIKYPLTYKQGPRY